MAMPASWRLLEAEGSNLTSVPLYCLEEGGTTGKRCIHAGKKAFLKSPDSDYLKVLTTQCVQLMIAFWIW